MAEFFDIDFDWDENKASRNVTKHGIHFEVARTVFNDPLSITVFDEGHSTTDERRWVTIGCTVDGRYVVVVHTWQDAGPNAARVRIISARPASKREERTYREVSR